MKKYKFMNNENVKSTFKFYSGLLKAPATNIFIIALK